MIHKDVNSLLPQVGHLCQLRIRMTISPKPLWVPIFLRFSDCLLKSCCLTDDRPQFNVSLFKSASHPGSPKTHKQPTFLEWKMLFPVAEFQMWRYKVFSKENLGGAEAAVKVLCCAEQLIQSSRPQRRASVAAVRPRTGETKIRKSLHILPSHLSDWQWEYEIKLSGEGQADPDRATARVIKKAVESKTNEKSGSLDHQIVLSVASGGPPSPSSTSAPNSVRGKATVELSRATPLNNLSV